jgi:hypothetical protein
VLATVFIMTVVEELIEYIKTHTSLNDPLRNDIDADIQIWLNKEKKQIIDAANNGCKSMCNIDAPRDGETYYKERFSNGG